MVSKLLVTPLYFVSLCCIDARLSGQNRHTRAANHRSRRFWPSAALTNTQAEFVVSSLPLCVDLVGSNGKKCRSHEVPVRPIHPQPWRCHISISLTPMIKRYQLSIPSLMTEIRLASLHTPSVHSGPRDLAHGSTSASLPKPDPPIGRHHLAATWFRISMDQSTLAFLPQSPSFFPKSTCSPFPFKVISFRSVFLTNDPFHFWEIYPAVPRPLKISFNLFYF